MTLYDRQWPGPPGQRGGTLKISPVDELARSDFDQGPSLARRRFSQLLTQASFTIADPLTQLELDAVKEFYRTDLRNGSRWFIMPIWQGGLLGYECQFTESMDISDSEAVQMWDVSVQLLIRDWMLPLTEVEYEMLDYFIDGGELFEFEDRLYNFATVLWPRDTGAF